jgi:hypothetical protein
MKNSKTRFALVCLLMSCFTPLLTTAQHDSIKGMALGLEINTMGNSPYVDFNSVLYYGYTGASGEAGTTTNKSFSLGVRGYFDLANNFSLKIRAGIRSSNVSVTISDTQGGASSVVLNETQNSYYLVAGCQQNIRINKFTHLHVGLDFDFTYYADLVQTINKNETSTYYNGYTYVSNSYSETDKYTTPGGVTFGIGPALGFDFKLGKHISAGSEVTTALLYETLGGKQTYTESNSMTGTSTQPFNFSLNTNGWTDSGVIASVYLMLTL